MTSSLVGSEMCIRDSLLYRSQCAGNGMPAANCTCYRQPPAIGPEALQGCLLYTSDAADDSSV
eukprot:3566469-Prorocentrum_lima.AAC.1